MAVMPDSLIRLDSRLAILIAVRAMEMVNPSTDEKLVSRYEKFAVFQGNTFQTCFLLMRKKSEAPTSVHIVLYNTLLWRKSEGRILEETSQRNSFINAKHSCAEKHWTRYLIRCTWISMRKRVNLCGDKLHHQV